MKLFFLFVINFLHFSGFSQSHFNEILPFEGQPNGILLDEKDDNLIIGSINFLEHNSESIPSTTLLSFSPETRTTLRNDVLRYPIARKGLYQLDNGFLLYSSDYFSNPRRIAAVSIDPNFDINNINTYTTPTGNVGPSSSIQIGDHIYGVSVDKDLSGTNELWLFTIFKFDLEGNLIWQKNFGQDGTYNFVTELDKTEDNNLLAALAFSPLDQNSGRARILKINQDGEIIWSFISEEKISNGADFVHVEQLSNGEFLNLNRIWKIGDPIYDQNDWNDFPYEFRWLNNEGELINKVIHNFHQSDNQLCKGIEKGKHGDYFFGYGDYWTPNFPSYDRVAVLTKFDNDGDTIWSRSYVHGQYRDTFDWHIINDIIEHENGDITCLGHITPDNELTNLWLFRVGPDGCPNLDSGVECGESVVITSIEDLEEDENEDIILYPNPTSDVITVDSEYDADSYIIVDLQGKLMQKGEVRSRSISLHDLPSGTYVVHIHLIDGRHVSRKISKL